MAEEIARRVVRTSTKVALTGLTAGLGAWAATAGVRQVLKRRADEALSLAAATPLGKVLPIPEAEPDAEQPREAPASTAAATPKPPTTATPKPPVAAAPKTKPKPEPEPARKPEAAPEPEPAPAPARPEPPAAAVEVGAPGVASGTADAVTEQLQREHSVPAEPTAADLPIPDFDNVSVASLRARLRQFGVEDLVVLREWELAHAHRLPVITMLDNRIAKVQAG